MLETNQNNNTNSSLLWETLKAVLRGEIISYTAYLKKTTNKRKQELPQLISDLDRQHALSPMNELNKQKLEAQAEFDLISTSEAERMLHTARGVLFEYGEKAGRLLANYLKGRRAAQIIVQIRNATNQITLDPHEINNTFMTFYSHLCLLK